jgi:CubicO group peptidase (beta-lactamase class C family)
MDLEKRLAELCEEFKVPGAALGVLHNGELTEVATGVINLSTGVDVTTDTLFQIGSVTKVWTTTVVMQLVDEGRVSLDVPVRTYLPTFKVADADVSERVTLRHLLSHTSGIDGDFFDDLGRGDDCIERYVDACATLQQTHPLGATMSYCNTGFTVAGRVIEVLTGTQWDQAMRERLFVPLGLKQTCTLPEEALLHRTAVGHMEPEPGADPEVASRWVLPRVGGPMGLINSTVGEVLAFAKMHMDLGRAIDGTQVLSKESVEAMQEPQVEIPNPHTLGSHWGVGWILFDWSGRKLYGHDGGTLGQSAVLRVAPDANLAVAILMNGGETARVARKLLTELFAELAGIDVPPLPEAPATPPDIDLSKYEGTYERLSVRLDLVAQDGKLVGTSTLSGALAEMIPHPVSKLELTPVDETTFLVLDEGASAPVPGAFYEFANGVPRYLHYGARTHPRVTT